MRAVQYAHLALFIRVDVVGPDHVDSGFLERQFSFKVALDHPQVENLGGVDQLVARAEGRQLGTLAFLLRIAGADAVDECRAEVIFLFNPLAKAVAQLPQVAVFQHAVAQRVAVAVDELADRIMNPGSPS